MESNSPDTALLLLTMISNSDELNNIRVTPEMKVDALMNMGRISINDYNNYSRAYSYLRQAAELAEKNGLTFQLAEIRLMQGYLYDMQFTANDFELFADTIQDLFISSFDNALASGNMPLVHRSIQHLMQFSIASNRMQQVRNAFKKYRGVKIEPTDTLGHFVLTMCEGIDALSRKQFDESKSAFAKTRKWALNNDEYMMGYHSGMAEMYNMTGNLPLAIMHMDSLNQMAKSTDSKFIGMQAERELSDYYNRLGNKEQSDIHRLRYFELKDTLLNAMHVSQIRDMHFLAEIDAVNSEMNDLNARYHWNKVLLIVVGISALIFAILLVLLIFNYRKTNKQRKSLYEQNLKLIEEMDTSQVRRRETLESSYEKGGNTNNTELSVGKETEDSESKTKETSNEAQEHRYQNSLLSPQDKERILEKIKKALSQGERILEADYQISTLADSIEESRRNVSQVINECCGCNFSTLLGEYRMREICKRINTSADFRKLTIEAMAECAGIKSRSNFSTLFKRFTGLTPSEYIRQAKIKVH